MNDIISINGIKQHLSDPGLSENIQIYQELDSTNREAKAQAVNKAPHGTVIIADYQTAGRGRYSRSFFSPRGTGLYISFILHSERIKFSSPTVITAYAGLCACEAIESLCGFEPAIKWVNDVYLNGKKICGILTEAITDIESGGIGELILGIGINFSTKTTDFPEEIKNRASSLYPDSRPPITRNRFAADIIDRILHCGEIDEKEIFKRYKKRLFILNTEINVTNGNERYKATAIDIDETGSLIVKRENGEIEKLSSGEVSIEEDIKYFA